MYVMSFILMVPMIICYLIWKSAQARKLTYLIPAVIIGISSYVMLFGIGG